MPSSNYEAIPWVLDAVRELNPKSILDVGTGAGKYGALFREYLDICIVGADPAKRRHIIDGVEIFEKNITRLHEEVYNMLYRGDIRSLMETLPEYDLIFMGDVIEHFQKAEGVAILQGLLNHARIAVIVVTPAIFIEQGCHEGNVHETHLSAWTKADFEKLVKSHCVIVSTQLVVAMLNGAYDNISSWLWRNRAKRSLKAILRRAYSASVGVLIGQKWFQTRSN
jgi:hypothetical protein